MPRPSLARPQVHPARVSQWSRPLLRLQRKGQAQSQVLRVRRQGPLSSRRRRRQQRPRRQVPDLRRKGRPVRGVEVPLVRNERILHLQGVRSGGEDAIPRGSFGNPFDLSLRQVQRQGRTLREMRRPRRSRPTRGRSLKDSGLGPRRSS